jgi:hypothetical protein
MLKEVNSDTMGGSGMIMVERDDVNGLIVTVFNFELLWHVDDEMGFFLLHSRQATLVDGFNVDDGRNKRDFMPVVIADSIKKNLSKARFA